MKKQLGFTLIELMVVVMIAALLAALAVPAYTAYIARGKIAQVVSARSDTQVYIRADQDAGYGSVVAAMAALQQGGVSNLGLVTEAPQ